MLKALEKAIQKVKALLQEQQAEAATLLDDFVGRSMGAYVLSAEEKQAIAEGVADLDAGRIVPDAEMEAFWNRHKK
jgi:hypothetical protein